MSGLVVLVVGLAASAGLRATEAGVELADVVVHPPPPWCSVVGLIRVAHPIRKQPNPMRGR